MLEHCMTMRRDSARVGVGGQVQKPSEKIEVPRQTTGTKITILVPQRVQQRQVG